MAINLNILTEYLSDILMKKAEHKYYMPISYVSIYQKELEIRYHTLYILESPRQFYEMESIEQSAFLIRGKIEKEDLEKTPHEVICVDSSISTLELFQKVCEVLEKYRKWEETLNHSLMTGGTITEMCEASVPFFENTMVVQNQNFELLGVGESEEIQYPYAYREGKSEYLALDIVLTGVPDAEVIFKRKEPFYYDYVPGYPSLLYNIFFHGKYAAQICVDAVNRPFQESDFSKIMILGKYIRTGLLHRKEDKRNLKNKFQNVFLEYILNPDVSQSKMRLALEQTNWDRQDEYRIGILDITETKRRNIGSSYLCDFISYRLPFSISAFTNHNIVLLINVTQSEKENKELEKDLEELKKTFGFTVGISDSFFDIMDVRLFLKQAEAAIQAGSWVKDKNVFLFTECRLEFVLKYGMDALPEKVLLPSQLRNLIRESKKTSDALLQTLKIYLKCDLNVNQTADKLIINRNTLKNRLKRLREILQTDFRDTDEILYLKMILNTDTN